MMLTYFAPNSGLAHVVVVCGFNDGGTGDEMIYYLRDPNYSHITVASSDSDGTVIIDYMGTKFYFWISAAYH